MDTADRNTLRRLNTRLKAEGIQVRTNRSARIHRGFHRLGILFASLIILIFIAFAFAETNNFFSYPAAFIFGFSLAAIGIYILTCAFGWIVAGFVGD